MTDSPERLHALFETLRSFDTPTLCNALDVVYGHRYREGFTTQTLLCAHPDLKPMVGRAKTARIRCSTDNGRSDAENLEARIAYYRYMSQVSGDWLCVVEDLDQEPVGAWWGEVHTALHHRFGLQGVLTNGAFRDCQLLAPGFQVLASKILPAHAMAQPVDHGGRVRVAGLEVGDGDIVHADRHGAVVIGEEQLEALPDAVKVIERREGRLLEKMRQRHFSFDQLEEVLRSNQDIH